MLIFRRMNGIRDNYILEVNDTVFVIAHAGDIQLIASALGKVK